MPLAKIAALSDVGHYRVHNQDAYLVFKFGGPSSFGGHLLGVFDGEGGTGSGRVASDMAADVVATTLRNLADDRLREDPGDHLEQAIRDASKAIYTKATDDRKHRGMGTTATVAVISDDMLHLAHVGDSRGYILRRGRLVQISRDQTLLNFYIAEGKILEEEIEDFPHKNVIMFALGVGPKLEVDRTSLQLRREDTLLLCTDGLWNLIGDTGIETVFRWHEDPESVCKALIDAANAAGGHDNITVVVAKFEDERLEGASEREAIADRSRVKPRADAVSWREASKGE